MNSTSSRVLRVGGAIAIIALVVTAVTGCSSPGAGGGSASAPTAGPTGAQLWSQNCGRCHNIRSPGMYSDAQWEVAMLHMRVRANLTGEEHRKILAFLKSAH